MNKRTIALIALVPLAFANALNAANFIELDWMIWPVILATIVAAVTLITTPTEEDLGNG